MTSSRKYDLSRHSLVLGLEGTQGRFRRLTEDEIAAEWRRAQQVQAELQALRVSPKPPRHAHDSFKTSAPPSPLPVFPGPTGASQWVKADPSPPPTQRENLFSTFRPEPAPPVPPHPESLFQSSRTDVSTSSASSPSSKHAPQAVKEESPELPPPRLPPERSSQSVSPSLPPPRPIPLPRTVLPTLGVRSEHEDPYEDDNVRYVYHGPRPLAQPEVNGGVTLLASRAGDVTAPLPEPPPDYDEPADVCPFPGVRPPLPASPLCGGRDVNAVYENVACSSLDCNYYDDIDVSAKSYPKNDSIASHHVAVQVPKLTLKANVSSIPISSSRYEKKAKVKSGKEKEAKQRKEAKHEKASDAKKDWKHKKESEKGKEKYAFIKGPKKNSKGKSKTSEETPPPRPPRIPIGDSASLSSTTTSSSTTSESSRADRTPPKSEKLPKSWRSPTRADAASPKSEKSKSWKSSSKTEAKSPKSQTKTPSPGSPTSPSGETTSPRSWRHFHLGKIASLGKHSPKGAKTPQAGKGKGKGKAFSFSASAKSSGDVSGRQSSQALRQDIVVGRGEVAPSLPARERTASGTRLRTRPFGTSSLDRRAQGRPGFVMATREGFKVSYYGPVFLSAREELERANRKRLQAENGGYEEAVKTAGTEVDFDYHIATQHDLDTANRAQPNQDHAEPRDQVSDSQELQDSHQRPDTSQTTSLLEGATADVNSSAHVTLSAPPGAPTLTSQMTDSGGQEDQTPRPHPSLTRLAGPSDAVPMATDTVASCVTVNDVTAKAPTSPENSVVIGKDTSGSPTIETPPVPPAETGDLLISAECGEYNPKVVLNPPDCVLESAGETDSEAGVREKSGQIDRENGEKVSQMPATGAEGVTTSNGEGPQCEDLEVVENGKTPPQGNGENKTDTSSPPSSSSSSSSSDSESTPCKAKSSKRGRRDKTPKMSKKNGETTPSDPKKGQEALALNAVSIMSPLCFSPSVAPDGLSVTEVNGGDASTSLPLATESTASGDGDSLEPPGIEDKISASSAPHSESSPSSASATDVRHSNGSTSDLEASRDSVRVAASDDVPATSLNVALTATSTSSLDSRASPEHFVVVAIDFGTTFSGYAFSFTKDPDNVYMMRKWAGEEPGVINQKTPTTMLLTPGGDFHSFGFTARNHYHNMEAEESKSWLYFEKFKMVLHHKGDLSKDTLLTASNGKKWPALQIFANALRYFKDHALQQLSDQSGFRILNEDIRWVITVPAIWKAPAKQFMRQAAYEAGLVTPEFPGQLLIALEPEAASIYCRRLRIHQLVPEAHVRRPLQSPSRSVPEQLDLSPAVSEQSIEMTALSPPIDLPPNQMLDSEIKGTRYMVVDCGGGTVDVTVHELDGQGRLRELHRATGGPHGAVGVDEEFEQLLCAILGADFVSAYKIKFPLGWVGLMAEFESRKRSAAPYRTNLLNVALPFSLIDSYRKHKGSHIESAIRRYGNSEVEWSPQGMLRLSPDAMKGLFVPTLSKIKQTIGDVLNHRNARDLQYMFLVGGFAESPILQHDLRREFSPIVKVLIPQEVSLAILKGAVLFGLDPKVVNMRRSRLTYGVGVLNHYDPLRHPPSKLVTRGGTDWCTDVLDKFVTVDQPIVLGDTVVRSYTPVKAGQDRIVMNVYCSERDDVEFITDAGVKKCGTLLLDLGQGQGDGCSGAMPSFGRRKIQVFVSFGDTEIALKAKDLSSGKCVQAGIDFLNK